MKNWLAGIVAFVGLVFFFFFEKRKREKMYFVDKRLKTNEDTYTQKNQS